MSKNKKFFLTGATGFIGSHLTEIIVKEGIKPYVLIPEGENLWRIKNILPSLKIVEGSLNDMKNLNKEINKIKPDICIHLAWYTEPGKYLSSKENISLLSNSLEFAYSLFSANCKRIITAGTCFEYDVSQRYLREESSLNPQTLYGTTKLAMELIIEKLSQIFKQEFLHFRLFYQYGQKEDKRRFIPYVINSLLSNKEVIISESEYIRDYLYVKDTAKAIWYASMSKLQGVLNIGSGNPIKNRDIAYEIGSYMDKLNLINFQQKNLIPYASFICADNKKLKTQLNWCPDYTLKEGLKETVEWWKKQIHRK